MVDDVTRGGGTGDDGDGAEISQLLLVLWRHRIFIAVTTAAACVLAIVFSFTQRPIYTARATLLPQEEGSSYDVLRPLASMVGAPLGSGGSYEELYSQIVTSDQVLEKALARDWQHADYDQPVTLGRVFGIDDGSTRTAEARSYRVKKKLRRDVVFFSRTNSGLMTLTVKAPGDGAFAAQLANFLVDQLGAFNARIQSSKVREKREAIEKRLAEIWTELDEAEQELTLFKLQNRSYESSPKLMLEYTTLAREVNAKSAIWLELRKQLELSKLEASDEESPVEVLDRATPPPLPSSPRRGLYAVLGLLGGFLGALLVLFLRHQIRIARRIIAQRDA